MGAYPVGIVGESFDNEDGSSRQHEIARCESGDPVALERDPQNKYDPNCVKVVSPHGIQIGNISRDDDWICERIDRGGFVDARILSIGRGELGYGVVLCVRTTEDDEWLTDKDRPVSPEQSTTGCGVVFAQIAVPALLLLIGCDDRPKHWNAYIYPNFEGSDRYETIAGFKSLDYCRWAAANRIKQLPEPERADYECGYMCRYDPQVDLSVCKETRK